MQIRLLAAALCLAGLAAAQTSNTSYGDRASKKHTSAKHDVGSGAGDVGKGVAKGAGSAAKGVGKTASDLVTLHPINAAADLGKGAVNTGKNVGVGAVKGTGKMVRGAGKAIKQIL